MKTSSQFTIKMVEVVQRHTQEEELHKSKRFPIPTANQVDVVIEVVFVEAEPLANLVQVAGGPLVGDDELDVLLRLAVVQRSIKRLLDVGREDHHEGLFDLLDGLLRPSDELLEGKSNSILLSRFSARHASRATMAFFICTSVHSTIILLKAAKSSTPMPLL